MARAAIKCGGWCWRWLVAALRPASVGCVVLAVSACAVLAAPVDDPDDDEAATPWYEGTVSAEEAARESWGGAEAFRRTWSLYTGSTYAPFSNLRQDGWRTRAVSAQSFYSYAGRRFDPASGVAIWQSFRGQARTIDMLAGYQWRTGDLTLKVFAGYQNTTVAIVPFDPETSVQGQKHGAKGSFEVWYNITPRHWAALDITAATPFRAYSHRLRVADRTFENVSLGVEAAAFGHQESATQRVGAFVRFDNGTHEISASGGWSMPRGDAGHAYGTVQWLYRF
jgi:Cellulose biosynthesis protein BcsS